MDIKNKNLICIKEGCISGLSARFLFDNYYKFNNKTKEEIEDEYFIIYSYKPKSDKLKNFIKNENIRGYESYIFFSITNDEVKEDKQFNKIHYMKFNTSSAVALSLCNISWNDEDDDDEENQHLI